MADGDKKTLERIGRLHAKLRELQAQTFEVTEEIGRLLAGDAGIGDVLKTIEATFDRVWRARYGSAYIWQYMKDRPQLKRLLREGLTVEDITARWLRYVLDDDAFYVKARHPFGLFIANINRFAEAGHATLLDEVETPADCRHTPRCRTDQEHTRRRSAEMRA